MDMLTLSLSGIVNSMIYPVFRKIGEQATSCFVTSILQFGRHVTQQSSRSRTTRFWRL